MYDLLPGVNRIDLAPLVLEEMKWKLSENDGRPTVLSPNASSLGLVDRGTNMPCVTSTLANQLGSRRGHSFRALKNLALF